MYPLPAIGTQTAIFSELLPQSSPEFLLRSKVNLLSYESKQQKQKKIQINIFLSGKIRNSFFHECLAWTGLLQSSPL